MSPVPAEVHTPDDSPDFTSTHYKPHRHSPPLLCQLKYKLDLISVSLGTSLYFQLRLYAASVYI